MENISEKIQRFERLYLEIAIKVIDESMMDVTEPDCQGYCPEKLEQAFIKVYGELEGTVLYDTCVGMVSNEIDEHVRECIEGTYGKSNLMFEDYYHNTTLFI